MDLSMAIAMRAGEELDFPPGYGLDSMGDMTDMMIEFDRLLKGLIVSIILIYLILVIQFGSFIQPLVMMLSIPLQLIGVFGALLLAQQTLSTVSILGIIILSGISVSAAILLLELILTKRQEGVPRADAIRQAGPVRLKAIFYDYFDHHDCNCATGILSRNWHGCLFSYRYSGFRWADCFYPVDS